MSWSHFAAMIRTLISFLLTHPSTISAPMTRMTHTAWLVDPFLCTRPLRLWLVLTHSKDHCTSIWLIPKIVVLGYVLLDDSYVISDLYINQADVALVSSACTSFPSCNLKLPWTLKPPLRIPSHLCLIWLSKPHRTIESLYHWTPWTHRITLAHVVHCLSLQGHNTGTCHNRQCTASTGISEPQ